MRQKVTDNRLWGLDILRILSISAVVLLHTAGQHWGDADVYGTEWLASNLFDAITRWAVPVFVMISGALFLDPQKSQPVKKLFKRNILHICQIILFWGFLYALCYRSIDITSTSSVLDFLKAGLYGHFHLWFLFMIIGLYVVTPILRCITKDEKTTSYFLALATVLNVILPYFSVLGGPFIFLDDFVSKFKIELPIGYIYYYVLGYFLMQIDVTNAKRKLAACLAFLGVAATFVFTTMISYAAGEPMGTFFSYFSPSVCIASIGFFIQFKDFKLRSAKGVEIVRVLSSSVLGVYMVHILILEKLLPLVGVTSTMCEPFVAIPATALATILLSFAFAAVLKKIPVFGRMFV